MAQFNLSATACTYTTSPTARCCSYPMLDAGKLARETVEAVKLADLDSALDTFRDKVAAAYGGSFFVFANLAHGSRAPSGYRQRTPYTFKREVDRDPGAQVAA